jgi:hypothetical protein
MYPRDSTRRKVSARSSEKIRKKEQHNLMISKLLNLTRQTKAKLKIQRPPDITVKMLCLWKHARRCAV